MRKLLLLAALSAALGRSQSGQNVNQVAALPNEPWIKLLFYDVSNNLQSLCVAKAIQPTTTYSVAAGNLTSITVATNVGTVNATAHKLYVGARLVVSGSATAALNGTYSASAAATNTLTIATSGVLDGTYTDMTITTVNPLTSAKVWAIELLTNPSNLLSSVYFALPNGAPSLGSGQQYTEACDNRSKY